MSPVDPGGDHSDPGELEPAPSVGRYLARQRRLRGVSLDDLESLTKIPRRSLERLEEGAFDGDADGFARGFVRTVAEALGLDPKETVMRLLGEPQDGDDAAEARRAQLRRWILAASALLAAAAAVVGLWFLWNGASAPRPDAIAPEIVRRRDVVRELAEQRRETRESGGSLDSPREGDPD